MSEQALIPAADRPNLPAIRENKRLSIRPKLRFALNLMVFGPSEGDNAGCALAMDEAARAAGITTREIRRSLDKPHVRQFLYQQKQVFRASASAQNISRLVAIRDTGGNAMAQLGAIKLLEDVDEAEGRKSAVKTPGVVIQIVNSAGGKDPTQVNTMTYDQSRVDE